jgi:hypothetical protein
MYTHPGDGYCVVIPDTYSVLQLEDGGVTIGPNVQAGMEPGLPFLAIEPAEPAEGKTAAQLVDEYVAFMLGGVEGIEATLSDATLDGAAAVRIDGIPGQDSNRQLIGVHDDVAYRLWVVPATVDYGDPDAEASAPYSMVVE